MDIGRRPEGVARKERRQLIQVNSQYPKKKEKPEGGKKKKKKKTISHNKRNEEEEITPSFTNQGKEVSVGKGSVLRVAGVKKKGRMGEGLEAKI